jgi:hypothetical protein
MGTLSAYNVMILSNASDKVGSLNLGVQWSKVDHMIRHVMPLRVNISTKHVKFRADVTPTSPFEQTISNTPPKALNTVPSMI